MIPLRDTIPSRRYPWVNMGIIGINVLVFFYELSLPSGEFSRLLARYGFVPLRFVLAGSWEDVSLFDRFFPVLTSMFLHGGWFHLLGNMLYLWIFGDNVEDRLGHIRYLAFYLACGIAAAFTQLLFHPGSPVPMVGASGAIAGVLGGYFILFPHSRVVALVPIWFFLQVVEIPAFFFLIFWFFIQFLNGISTPVVLGGVAWWAHIGGFLSGIVLILIFSKRRKEEREWF